MKEELMKLDLEEYDEKLLQKVNSREKEAKEKVKSSEEELKAANAT